MARYFLSIIGFAAAMVLASGPSRAQEVTLPEFSPEARKGGLIFMGKCARCHGFYLQGTKKGPTFLDSSFLANHHSDQAFRDSIRVGVVQHHWPGPDGGMKPVPGVTDDQASAIIRFVRELQKANGIF